jgi:hypothetical protein
MNGAVSFGSSRLVVTAFKRSAFDATAVTPVRKLLFGTFAPETTLQLVPFQCSIKVPFPFVWLPTAQTSLLATAAALPKLPPSTEGVGITLQLDPLKCSASDPELLPNAQISLSAMARVALRLALLIVRTTWRPFVSSMRCSRYSTRRLARRSRV